MMFHLLLLLYYLLIVMSVPEVIVASDVTQDSFNQLSQLRLTAISD